MPVAGLGTSFFPATRAIPKEMLTIVAYGLRHPDLGEQLKEHLKKVVDTL
jgi:UTP-glucose-1-phosphate uridylyltransferase